MLPSMISCFLLTMDKYPLFPERSLAFSSSKPSPIRKRFPPLPLHPLDSFFYSGFPQAAFFILSLCDSLSRSLPRFPI